MRKTLKFFMILVVSLLVMVACNNADSTTEDNGESKNESTEEIDQTNDEEENLEEENEETKDSDSQEVNGGEEVPVLELGEMGVIKDTLGIYEVTPKSVRYTDSLGEDNDIEEAVNGRFVVVEIDIKNIGSETLDLEDITKADLYSNTGTGGTGFSNYPEIIQFEGEINPEESFIGHIVFDVSERGEDYEIAFGANMPAHISNEIRWVLPMEDAE